MNQIRLLHRPFGGSKRESEVREDVYTFTLQQKGMKEKLVIP